MHLLATVSHARSPIVRIRPGPSGYPVSKCYLIDPLRSFGGIDGTIIASILRTNSPLLRITASWKPSWTGSTGNF
jgi:hypothetical protein